MVLDMRNRVWFGCCLSAVALLLFAGNIPFQASAQSNVSTFTIPGLQSLQYNCGYLWADFNAVVGQEVSLHWNSSSASPVAIGVYISTPTAVSGKWYCGVGPTSLHSATSAYGSTQWAPPSTGSYELVIVNPGAYEVSVTVSIVAANGTTIPLSATGRGICYFPPSVGGGGGNM